MTVTGQRAVVTTWVETPEGGRARGPRGLLRAWFEVVIHPRRFFHNGVAPGDQAPGLVFAVVVALLYVGTLIAVDPTTVPTVFGGRVGSAVVAVAATGLLLAPATLHLTAAIQTVVLILVSVRVRATLAAIRGGDGWLVTADRAGVSETVQVVAYAAGPCVLAGLPLTELRAASTLYAGYLLVVGLAEVHDLSPARAITAGTVPAALVFGYGFGGFDAIAALLTRWYVI
jgi:hypothetical protein